MQDTMIRNTNKLVYISANIFPRESEKKNIRYLFEVERKT